MAGLATRCPACGTVFRVVPDQLRVSEGWVRCGRCADVFNATEALVDLDSGAPRRLGDAAPVAADFAATPASSERVLPALDPPLPASPPQRPPAAQFVVTREAEASAAETEPPAPSSVGATSRPAALAPDDELPSFVRHAERAARWRRPRVRAALAAAGVLALAGLAAQVLIEYRDLVAARYTAVRPALEQACAWFGCSIDPAHAIDSLAVESSGLLRVEKSNVYRLSVALRNRGGIELALPALDLSLTDSQGKLLARRVLRAGELGAAQATLGTGRELILQAALQAATEPVAGYTIELFYP